MFNNAGGAMGSMAVSGTPRREERCRNLSLQNPAAHVRRFTALATLTRAIDVATLGSSSWGGLLLVFGVQFSRGWTEGRVGRMHTANPSRRGLSRMLMTQCCGQPLVGPPSDLRAPAYLRDQRAWLLLQPPLEGAFHTPAL